MEENEKITYKIETTSNGKKRILLPDEMSITTDTTLLTKTELHALRKVRRKLKNKISAQESRRRKKEYIENLEKRVCLLNEENELLKKKVEAQDLSLRSLTRQIHQRINYKEDKDEHRSIGTQTGICLKCYLYKRENSPRLSDDFEVKTGKNGRIVIKSEPILGRKAKEGFSSTQSQEKTSRSYSDDDVFL